VRLPVDRLTRGSALHDNGAIGEDWRVYLLSGPNYRSPLEAEHGVNAALAQGLGRIMRHERGKAGRFG